MLERTHEVVDERDFLWCSAAVFMSVLDYFVCDIVACARVRPARELPTEHSALPRASFLGALSVIVRGLVPWMEGKINRAFGPKRVHVFATMCYSRVPGCRTAFLAI